MGHLEEEGLAWLEVRAQELQRLILGGTHLLRLARGLVIEPAEV